MKRAIHCNCRFIVHAFWPLRSGSKTGDAAVRNEYGSNNLQMPRLNPKRPQRCADMAAPGSARRLRIASDGSLTSA
jgi:hypothetical protein